MIKKCLAILLAPICLLGSPKEPSTAEAVKGIELILRELREDVVSLRNQVLFLDIHQEQRLKQVYTILNEVCQNSAQRCQSWEEYLRSRDEPIRENTNEEVPN